MPCMCGDLYCPSCGPAQGNSKCPICGVWTDEGGCADPAKCEAEAAKQAEAEAYEDAIIGLLEEMAAQVGQQLWDFDGGSNEWFEEQRQRPLVDIQAERQQLRDARRAKRA